MHKLFKTRNLSYPIYGYSILPNTSLICSSYKTLSSSSSKWTFRNTDSLEERPDHVADAGESTVQISHPWPEWVDFMKCLLKRGYFEGDRNPFVEAELGSKELNRIRTACLNFARNQSDLIRYLSKKDIQIIVAYGCPSVDRKVVNSGKRLRAYVGIDERNVCRSCNLRGGCERAYIEARQDKNGRTVDVMRVLLMYGLEPISVIVENKPCLNKAVKESGRRLIKELVEHSTEELHSNHVKIGSMENQSCPQEEDHEDTLMKPGDWLCPKCTFINFSRNVKCLRCDYLFEERLREMNKDLDHLPLLKGDWKCEKCNFLNFAKNSRCLLCKENPPKRHLNPGEWECESCNYINFRKNMVCLRCDHRRIKTSNTSETSPNGNYHADSEHSFGQDGRSRNRDSGKWRFLENDKEDEASGFIDFPISGGKSELSHNTEMIERWKVEMVERRKFVKKKRERENRTEKEQSLRSGVIPSRFELSESGEDEEIAEWFGTPKKETEI